MTASNASCVVNVRAPTKREARHLASLQMPAPLIFPGQVVRCTNANASEFSYMQRYRVERVCHPGSVGPALAVVRNNLGDERVLSSLSWCFGHWEVVRG